MANVTPRPFGISLYLLGALLELAGIALLVHSWVRHSRTRKTTPTESGSGVGALLFRRRLVVRGRSPFVSLEPMTQPSRYGGIIDKETYWGIALIVAGIGAFLGAD
jgi:hypothetical protein